MDNVAVRISQELTPSDNPMLIDNVLREMVAEAAFTTVSDDVLEQALRHIADRGFTLAPEPPVRRAS